MTYSDDDFAPRRAAEGEDAWHADAEGREVRVDAGGLLPSITRTVTPMIAGQAIAGLTGLAEWAGASVPADLEGAVYALVAFAVSVAYYVAARLLERAGFSSLLLGSRQAPTYE